jgi:hypothetical protein
MLKVRTFFGTLDASNNAFAAEGTVLIKVGSMLLSSIKSVILFINKTVFPRINGTNISNIDKSKEIDVENKVRVNSSSE